MKQNANPLETILKLDPELYDQVSKTKNLAYADKALPKKYAYLIALALDASDGAENGVKNLAKMAMDSGATKDEIASALRVVMYIKGVQGIYTAARALQDIVNE